MSAATGIMLGALPFLVFAYSEFRVRQLDSLPSDADREFCAQIVANPPEFPAGAVTQCRKLLGR